MVLEGPAPAFPLLEGPLRVNGKRRAGPNRWGYDPYAPLLAPVPTRKPPHKICQDAARYWSSRETFEARNRTHPELLRRRKRGARRNRTGPQIGRYPEHQLDVRHHKRGDRTSVHYRILAFCALRASLRSGAVGLWDGKEIRAYDREELAAAAKCPVRVDDKGRVRCERLDRAISDLVAAGLLFRFQTRELDATGEYKSHAATLKVTPLFWLAAGVGPRRDRVVKKAKKNAAKVARGPLLQDPAAQARGFIAKQAAGHVPDYGPTGPEAGRDERRRMRDEYEETARRPYRPWEDEPPPK